MASSGDNLPADTPTINTNNIVTLTRFLTEEQTKVKEATGDFTYVLRMNEYEQAYMNFYLHTEKLQITLPCSPVLVQGHFVLYPSSYINKPDRFGWTIQRNG